MINDLIKDANIVFLFPCFYEIIRTKFVKNKIKLDAFESLLKSSRGYSLEDYCLGKVGRKEKKKRVLKEFKKKLEYAGNILTSSIREQVL